ncbi:MAG: hypothetical protein HZC43_09710 [Nitrosomonadales bacterium]|nr:hypothetical protein [Nitrosomonadales bacterium]
MSFTLADRHAAYDWMADTLDQFGYARRIKQFTTGGGRIKDRRHPPAVPFVQRYSVEDIRLLAEMDALHGTLSGTTTRKLCERAFRVHGEARYELLAEISNGH